MASIIFKLGLMLTNGFGGTFHLHNTLDDKVGYNALDYH